LPKLRAAATQTRAFLEEIDHAAQNIARVRLRQVTRTAGVDVYADRDAELTMDVCRPRMKKAPQGRLIH